MGQPSLAQITGLLQRWSQGEEHALDSLTPVIYHDRRRMAANQLREASSG